jgi:hypothetical protein
VVAAIFLVGAFALATLLPPMLSLDGLLSMIDRQLLVAAQDLTITRLSPWLWTNLAVPLLMRPCWLLPTGLGLICAGASLTVGSHHRVRRSHRRQS